MAVLRSDIIIPEIFTPYVIEQTTQRDSFLARHAKNIARGKMSAAFWAAKVKW